ncbi:MAG: hypothetical protein LIP08_05495 [Bacteroides sp.]|nr:hypothetical protein [Bacteroides sp.]
MKKIFFTIATMIFFVGCSNTNVEEDGLTSFRSKHFIQMYIVPETLSITTPYEGYIQLSIDGKSINNPETSKKRIKQLLKSLAINMVTIVLKD